MFRRQIDMLCVGDMTTDAFIRLKEAHVHCRINRQDCELCMKFGEKIPFEYVKVVHAVGNAGNAAVAAARLGLHSAIVSNIGADQNGRDCLNELMRNKVVTSFVKVHDHRPSNYHFVLWYDSDRTILVNHVEYNYHWPSFPEPRWLYLTSLAAHAYPYHDDIAKYLDTHQKVKLAFQPGTFQIGIYEHLKHIYARTEVFICNIEEAQKVLNEKKPEIKVLLDKIAGLGPKLVLITDSSKGAFLFDGDHYYHMPIYPNPRPPLERTGCGDAFATTFVAALIKGKTPLEALALAPINPMSVAQFIGSQEGLLSMEQLEWWQNRAPQDYKPREI